MPRIDLTMSMTPAAVIATESSAPEEPTTPSILRLRIPLPFRDPIRKPRVAPVAPPGSSGAAQGPPAYRRIRVADQLVRVADGGWLILGDTLTYGYALPGTPYRTVPIGGREYLVHDLVWRAFHGDPPPGFEVRHTRAAAEEALSAGRLAYDNALASLQICQTNIQYQPRLAAAAAVGA